MKKTIITAMLGLGLVTAAFAETSYTLGDITYTTTSSLSSSGHVGGYTSFTFTLNYESLNTGVLSTTAETSSGETLSTLPTEGKVGLSSITLTKRNNYNDVTTLPTLTITEVGNDNFTAITSTSAAKAFDDVDVSLTGGGTAKRDGYVWTFDTTNAVLEVGKTYTVTFSSQFGISAVPQDGNTAVALSGGYMPGNMTIETQSLNAAAVPEPATATLSLLALAGLAARRRRK